MFDFLNGIFLYGLAGVSLPFLIHFFARPKFQVVRFSSVAFLKRILQESAKRFRLQRSFLLFLRTLAVLFLVLGFAQPVWRGPSKQAFSMSPGHSMVFLDASASMQRQGVWEKAQERAKEVLEQISSKSQIHFWRMGVSSHGTTGTKEALVHEIQTCPLSNQRGHVLHSLQQGISFLEKAGAFSPELFLISDFQRTDFSTDGKGLFENRLKQWKGILYAIPVVGDQANLAIEDAGLEWLPGASGYSLRVFAKLRNWDKEEREILIRFFINSRAVAQKTLLIKPKEVIFETMPLTLMERGYLEGKVELESNSDAFLLDNTRFFCGFVPERIRILLVGHDVSDVNPYRWALEESQGPDSLFQIQIRTGTYPWLSLLDEADIFILSNYDALSSEEAKAIRRFLEKGKSVWLVLGDAVKLDSYNQGLFLPCWGDSLHLSLKPLDSNMYLTLGHVDLEDPFLQGVFQSTVRRIPSPHFFRTVEFHGDSFRPIFRLSNGDPLLAEFSYGEGALLVLGTGLEKNWSNLAYTNFFPPWVYRTIHYLSQARYKKAGSGLVGDPLTLLLPVSVVQPRIEVTLPSGEKETLVPEFQEGRPVVRFFSTERPGIYRFYEHDKPFATWAINVDPKESDFRSISQDTFSTFFPNARVLWVDPKRAIAEYRLGTSLWKFFFILALGALVAESFLSQWREKNKNFTRR